MTEHPDRQSPESQTPEAPGHPAPDPFGAIAASYDRMGFLTLTARHLVQAAALQPGERVLDVATGTGSAAMAAAVAVGPGGTVVGLDLSAPMLAQARLRAAGLPGLNFVEGDAMQLPFPDHDFDVVLCASALFFMPDLVAALREWRRVLRPGGRVGFTAFAPGLMSPLPAMWAAALAPYGLKAAGPPIGRLPSPERAGELLREAGFTVEGAAVEPLPYRLDQPEDRWADIEAGLEGLALRDLPPATRAALRDGHLAQLGDLFAGQPLTVEVPLIVAFGRR